MKSEPMTCPDCSTEMVKAEIQLPDMTWAVVWFCQCEHGDERIRLHLHHEGDWTAPVLLAAADELREGHGASD